MNTNKKLNFSSPIPSIKEALRLVGFKEITANVFAISEKKLQKPKRQQLQYS